MVSFEGGEPSAMCVLGPLCYIWGSHFGVLRRWSDECHECLGSLVLSVKLNFRR